MDKIKFIEKSHQYISDSGSELISVSAFTDRFKEKTNWEEIARKVARKESRETGKKVSERDILAKWERKRNISAEIGTLYHTIRENESLLPSENVFYDEPCNVRSCIYEDLDKWSIPINNLENNTVYRELMIYDVGNMICGQSDKVIIANDTINIWDYKTDYEISFKGFSSKWVSPKKLLPPLSHLDECNGNIYSIKMSLYMYMLWNSNRGRLKPGEIIIEHVHLERNKENDNLPVLVDGKPVVRKIEKIKLPYRRKEVEAMLKTINHE
jgi:hypothetical protein